MLAINEKLSCNSLSMNNLIIEGNNVSVMESLCLDPFNKRGQIDFMLWDPPYNTCRKDMIYNDKMPHENWLSFMEIRLNIAKDMLKESGNIAIHISYQELFRLGILMDKIFNESNRLGIINWECTASPKNNSKGIPSTTDYVLIYAKNKKKHFQGIIPRTAEMDARYNKIDNQGQRFNTGDLSSQQVSREYAAGNLTVQRHTPSGRYGIENPFTQIIHYPSGGRSWRQPSYKIREQLCEWGIEFIIDASGNVVVKPGEDRKKAEEVLRSGYVPRIYFGKSGTSAPVLKRNKDEIKNKGRILCTYWEYPEILDVKEDEILNISMRHETSGLNAGAKQLIKAILGDNCIFSTPKPMKLTERLIEMCCPNDGIVLDAFGGSATTAHAVLNMNHKGSRRSFIIIESESFTETITAERVRRVINGNWEHPRTDTQALGGEFVYLKEIL